MRISQTISQTNSYAKLVKEEKKIRILSENICDKNNNLKKFISEKLEEGCVIFYEKPLKEYSENIENLIIFGETFSEKYYEEIINKLNKMYQNIFLKIFEDDNIDYQYISNFKESFLEKIQAKYPENFKNYYYKKIELLQNFLENVFFKRQPIENFSEELNKYIEDIKFLNETLIFWKYEGNLVIIADKNFNNFSNYFSDLDFNTEFFGEVSKEVSDIC